jgi:hypothetical protein
MILFGNQKLEFEPIFKNIVNVQLPDGEYGGIRDVRAKSVLQ